MEEGTLRGIYMEIASWRVRRVRVQYTVMSQMFNMYRVIGEMIVVMGEGVFSSAVYAPPIIPKEGRLPQKAGNGLRRNLGLGG